MAKNDWEKFLDFMRDEYPRSSQRIYTVKEVCPRCCGEGTHVNPSIDGNGISADEWYNEWDDESREMYLTGGYDVTCEECHGSNVVDVLDETRTLKVIVDRWNEWIHDEWAYRAECAAERRMGA